MISAAGNGGVKTETRPTGKQTTSLSAPAAVRSSQPMETGTGSTAALTAISEIGLQLNRPNEIPPDTNKCHEMT